MTKMKSYWASGFKLISTLVEGLKTYPVAASTSLTLGQAVFDNGSGYATTGTAFALTFLGFAVSAVANSTGNAGDKDVQVIPPNPAHMFEVPNGSVTVATQSDVTEVIDLEAAGTVDVTDETVVQWGFKVDKIDITADALTANAGGYVIGRMLKMPA